MERKHDAPETPIELTAGNSVRTFMHSWYDLSGSGFNKSFNGRFRDELLNGEMFETLREAKVVT